MKPDDRCEVFEMRGIKEVKTTTLFHVFRCVFLGPIRNAAFKDVMFFSGGFLPSKRCSEHDGQAQKCETKT